MPNGSNGIVFLPAVDGRKPAIYGNSIMDPEDHLTQNPIHKVFSVRRSHKVKFLLMGGQACVLYGGAEFSRDTDIVILPDEKNLSALINALDEHKAEVIAVLQCTLEYLKTELFEEALPVRVLLGRLPDCSDQELERALKEEEEFERNSD